MPQKQAYKVTTKVLTTWNNDPHSHNLFKPTVLNLCCLALPCLALPLLALPCLALPCLALPCLAMPCHAMPCHAMPCKVNIPCGWEISNILVHGLECQAGVSNSSIFQQEYNLLVVETIIIQIQCTILKQMISKLQKVKFVTYLFEGTQKLFQVVM